MTDAWVITTGEYSDMTPYCVVLTEELAHQICEALKGEGLDSWTVPVRDRMPIFRDGLMLEWYYDPDTSEEWGPTEETWQRWSFDDGKTWEDGTYGMSRSIGTKIAVENPIRPTNRQMQRDPRSSCLRVRVTWDDPERARKVFSEQRAHVIADALIIREKLVQGLIR
jgi:hypothetical protein